MAGYTPRSFAIALLGQLGIQPNARNVKAIVGWSRAEGGHWNNSARYNPLNTTLNLPGASAMNSVGVKAYNSWDQGLNATVKTLKNGRYGGILHALQTGGPRDVARAIDQSPWGTHGSLIYQAIAGTPAKPVHAGSQKATSLAEAVATPSLTTVNPPGSSSVLSSLLSQQAKPQVPVTAPAPVSFGADRYLRGASAGEVPSTPPLQQGGSLAEQLSALSSAPSLVASTNVTGAKAAKLAQVAIPATGQPGDSPITAPGSMPDRLRAFVERANAIDKKHMPYVWGGGHARTGKADRGTGRDPGIGFDCSGAVSAVLGVDPRVSGQFAQWGRPGRGKQVTIYANGHHVLMEINGHFFGTSQANPGGGAGWIPRSYISKSYLSQFTARHPRGL